MRHFTFEMKQKKGGKCVGWLGGKNKIMHLFLYIKERKYRIEEFFSTLKKKNEKVKLRKQEFLVENIRMSQILEF